MSDIISSLIGAVVGGLIAYLIVLVQLKYQKEQQNQKDINEKQTKEIQLLWQIYFDIKKEVENTDLWSINKENLNSGFHLLGTSIDMYLREILPSLMGEIKELFILLERKEEELKSISSNELNLLWIRNANLLKFVSNVAIKHSQMINHSDQKTIQNYNMAQEILAKHFERLSKSKNKSSNV